MAAADASINEKQSQIKELNQQIEDVESIGRDRINELKDKWGILPSDSNPNEGKLYDANKDVEIATANLNAAQSDLEEFENKLQAASTAKAEAQVEVDNLQKKISGTTDTAVRGQLTNQLADAEEKLQTASSELTSYQSQNEEYTAKVKQAQQQLDEAKDEQQQAQADYDEVETLRSDFYAAGPYIEQFNRSISELNDAIKADEKTKADAQAKLDAAKKKVAETTKTLEAAQANLTKAQQRLDALKQIDEIQQKFEDGHWRLYDGAGHRLTDFQRIEAEKKTVYYDKNGNMLYDQQNIDGKWYNFDKVTGAMSTGLTYLADQKKTVYYNDKGQMLYGKQVIGGKTYEFDKVTGALLK